MRNFARFMFRSPIHNLKMGRVWMALIQFSVNTAIASVSTAVWSHLFWRIDFNRRHKF